VNSRNGVYIYIYIYCFSNSFLRSKKEILHATLNFSILEMASGVAFDKLGLYVQILSTCHLISPDRVCNRDICLFPASLKLILIFREAHPATARPISNKHRCCGSLSYSVYSQKYILNYAMDIFCHSVYSEVQPQDLPASHIASLISGNEEVVGPGWCGDPDGWQRISHLLSGKGKRLSYCPGHLWEYREIFTNRKAAEREVYNLHLSRIKVKNTSVLHGVIIN
jgi:hypothetical protein